MWFSFVCMKMKNQQDLKIFHRGKCGTSLTLRNEYSEFKEHIKTGQVH